MGNKNFPHLHVLVAVRYSILEIQNSLFNSYFPFVYGR